MKTKYIFQVQKTKNGLECWLGHISPRPAKKKKNILIQPTSINLKKFVVFMKIFVRFEL